MSSSCDREAGSIDRNTRLHNGASLVEGTRILAGPNKGSMVVLCCTADMAGTAYVTWQMDGKGNAFWGHYNDDISAAVHDYHARINRLATNSADEDGLHEYASERFTVLPYEARRKFFA